MLRFYDTINENKGKLLKGNPKIIKAGNIYEL